MLTLDTEMPLNGFLPATPVVDATSCDLQVRESL